MKNKEHRFVVTVRGRDNFRPKRRGAWLTLMACFAKRSPDARKNAVQTVVKMIQADAIRYAAEHAQKIADTIGQDDPRTGDQPDFAAHRQDGAHAVYGRLMLLAIEVDKPSPPRCKECNEIIQDFKEVDSIYCKYHRPK